MLLFNCVIQIIVNHKVFILQQKNIEIKQETKEASTLNKKKKKKKHQLSNNGKWTTLECKPYPELNKVNSKLGLTTTLDENDTLQNIIRRQ